MKTALYVAAVTRTYRRAIDDFLKDPELYQKNLPWYKEEIGKCTYREFTTGFFFGKPGPDEQIYGNSTYVKNYTYLGTAGEADENCRVVLLQKNKFSRGDRIEIMKPDGRNLETEVLEIADRDGNLQESAPHARQELHVRFSVTPEPLDILRVRTPENETDWSNG